MNALIEILLLYFIGWTSLTSLYVDANESDGKFGIFMAYHASLILVWSVVGTSGYTCLQRCALVGVGNE
jgi:hypothetical protein